MYSEGQGSLSILVDVLPFFSRVVGATCLLGSGVTFPLGTIFNVCGQVFPPFFSRAAGATCLLRPGVTFPLGIILKVHGQVWMSGSAVSFMAEFHGVECLYVIGPGFGVWEYP